MTEAAVADRCGHRRFHRNTHDGTHSLLEIGEQSYWDGYAAPTEDIEATALTLDVRARPIRRRPCFVPHGRPPRREPGPSDRESCGRACGPVGIRLGSLAAARTRAIAWSVARRSILCRPPSAMRPLRPWAAACKPGRPTARRGLWRCEGLHPAPRVRRGRDGLDRCAPAANPERWHSRHAAAAASARDAS